MIDSLECEEVCSDGRVFVIGVAPCGLPLRALAAQLASHAQAQARYLDYL